jgi:hypothetical protein
VSARLAEVLAVLAVATAITVVLAAAVLRSPSERIFGMGIVGRHHDPFTVMQQFEGPISIGIYSQPVTDITGALASRVVGPVAAYNWLILISFPFAAATTYLLARHLALPPAAAAVAALAYAFSPFHLAHAAYHPHIAQTQWIPLYLLALWRCLDAATPAAVAFLGIATLAVTLSNFYGGLIAAVITPAAVGTYWFVMRQVNTRPTHALSVTLLSLTLMAACGLAYASYAAPGVIADGGAFAFARGELFLYSAKWWSYLVPPVAHPLFGSTAHRVWQTAGVGVGLLEQQVSLGWGMLALAGVAVGRWLWLIRTRHSGCDMRVPVLVVVAVTALVCSLSPERTIGTYVVAAPSALLYSVLPMFRSYARFGIVVQLMAALLAGIGVDFLRRAGGRGARMLCAAFVALIIVEYAVAPSALWRDVLPTTAHRWVTHQPGNMRVLDCALLNQKSQSIAWLTGYRVVLTANSPSDCAEPNLPQRLAATGYTHLLVRRDTAEGRWFARHTLESGFRIAANLVDAQVLAVTALPPPIYTAAMPGFFRREHSDSGTWQWMPQDGAWNVVNTGGQPIVAMLAVELWAFRHARDLEVRFDGEHIQSVVVERARHFYRVGPLTVPPGEHRLLFHSSDIPMIPDKEEISRRDRRTLSVAVGDWNWNVENQQP